MNKQNSKREHFSSRLGFILVSAGCAIGLGNVWKFPTQVGECGGAAFLILYLICVVLIGLPLMTFEFAVGRASQKTMARSFEKLEPKNTKWHNFKWGTAIGLYTLMSFYTTICGWIINYIIKEATGTFSISSADLSQQIFNNMISNPWELIIWMAIACSIGLLICIGGVQNGVEKITKVLMLILLVVLIALAGFSVMQPGAEEGIMFYLHPNFNLIFESPSQFLYILFQAMSLAFFTMSVGMGSMSTFGSYINKERSLFGESIIIGLLNVGVAVITGLIIFPSCFSYGIQPDSGPGLIFQTLPTVFANMSFGSIIGAFFFLFLSFASISTLITVYENIIAFWMEQKGWSRKKSALINYAIIIVISIPCCLCFNVWSDVGLPFKNLTHIIDIEDFIVSSNILPIGGIVFAMFCSWKKAWGWKSALKEINTGKGLKMPYIMKYITAVFLPIVILAILVLGWISALA